MGQLLNAWIASGGAVAYDEQGTQYGNIGTPTGYPLALRERVGTSDRAPPPYGEGMTGPPPSLGDATRTASCNERQRTQATRSVAMTGTEK